MQRIKESSPSKKLSLIYLANGNIPTPSSSSFFLLTLPEIVQQSKIRKKDEFVKSYDPIIAEATAAAYKGSPSEIQNKIRRVVEVWRQRLVFSKHVQDQIESAIDEIDRSRSGRKPALGGSLFSSSAVPPELTTVAPLATTLQKADVNTKPAVTAANQEYDKLTNPNYAIPTPPMHAAALAALVKKLATAEGAVAESIKARTALITGLEKLLDTNKAKLQAEESQVDDLVTKKAAIEGRKREVEEAILKGLSAADQHAISAAPLPLASRPQANPAQESVARPAVEELTPPPMESFTPVGSPQPHVPDDVFPEPVSHPVEPIAVPPANGSSSILSEPATAIGAPNPSPVGDLSAYTTHVRPVDDQSNGAQMYHSGTFKKRKMSRSAAEDEFAAFAADGDIEGIDASLENLI